MNITKYMHACLVIEKDNQRIVVDPGVWSTDFVIPENVTAVIITHEHPDHFDPEKLAAIFDKNPASVLIAHETITQKLPDHNSQAVIAGETIDIGGFTLRFTGGEHAIIHTSYPTAVNLGVMIDETLYYPGDSFAPAGAAVHTLALPVSAPWMRFSDAMDFMVTTAPQRVFPTHDAILSETGKALADRMFSQVAEQNNLRYERLILGESTEL
jgi:L-ascorbate metabolism protein UlaG (beta-lactamase superfamily)